MRNHRVGVGGLTFYSDIDDLNSMSPKEKVDWLRQRFEKVVIEPLREVERLGRHNPAIWVLNLGVVTIICAAIEALGSFYETDKKDREAFPDFVHKFMHSQYRRHVTGSKKTYGHVLYEQFRCGLAHGLTIEGHEIATRPRQYLHDDSGCVSIDLWSLFEDMRRAFARYLTKVHTDKAIRACFLRRFDKLVIQPYPKKTLKSGVVGTRITVISRGSQ